MSEKEIYLLDKKVEFQYSHNVLSSRDGLPSINLQVPASLCLLILLKKQGVVVSQEDLMIAGWGDRSNQITPNTFYQTILHLRRSLEKMGLDKGFIQTIKRRGLFIDERWSISIKKEDVNKTQLTTQSKATAWKEKQFVFLSIMVFFSGVLVLFLPAPKPAFSDYKLLTGVAPMNCTVFTNNKADYERLLRIINKTPTVCEKKTILYITEFSYINQASVMACKKTTASEGAGECKSFYFPDFKE